MPISAESLIIGPHDPWDSLDPVVERGLRLVDADPVISEYAIRWPTLMAKVISLRGVVEVPNNELPIVYAARMAVAHSIVSIEDPERTEEARFWLENTSSFVPYATDFSLIDVYRIERAIKESPFMGIAYEYLPAGENLPKKNFKKDDAIIQIRSSLHANIPNTAPPERPTFNPSSGKSRLIRNSAPGRTTQVKVNPKYL